MEFRGARRVPQDTLKALIVTKPGDLFNEDTVRRDFMDLWNTGRFDDIRLETEPGKTGLIVRFVVIERRVIRSINYEGITRSPCRKSWTASKSGKSASRWNRSTIRTRSSAPSWRSRTFSPSAAGSTRSVDPQIEQIPPSSLK